MEEEIIQQVSIDIEGAIDLEDVQEVLRRAGYKVEGIAWKATWKKRDYWESKPPIAYD